MCALFAEDSLSNQGGRGHNEDYTLALSLGGTYCRVVADGLGGHHGGEVASRIACEAAIKSFQANTEVTAEAVAEHIRNADDAIRHQQRANSAQGQMKSTIVMLVANASRAVYGHVGDTRLYHFRAGRIFQHTKDHSMPQKLVDAGEITPSEIRHHDDRSRLLRALGEDQPVRASVISEPVSIGRGDAFLLCTDGFWENVIETEMEIDLSKSASPKEWLKYMEDRLQERVSGGFDNYTAAAVLGDSLPVLVGAGSGRESNQEEIPRLDHRHHFWLGTKILVYLVIPILLAIGATSYLLPPHWRSRPASTAAPDQIQNHNDGAELKDKPGTGTQPDKSDSGR